jgi:hypothetical protein
MSYKRRKLQNQIQLNYGAENVHLPKNVPVMNNGHPAYKRGYVHTPQMIPLDHPEVTLAAQYVERQENLDSVDWTWIKDPVLAKHLIRITECLRWYEYHIPSRLGNGKGILYQNLSRKSEFADELDDLIKYSLRYSGSTSVVYGTDEWPPDIRTIKTLDDFFSPYHLLPFPRPESEDILLIEDTLPPIDKTLLFRFTELIEEFFHHPEESPWEVDDLTRLEFLTASKTFIPGQLKRAKKTDVFTDREHIHTTDLFEFDWVDVYKEPHESRSCVVPSPPTLVTLRLLERRMEQVISCPHDCIRDSDLSWVPEYLSGYSHWNFLQSDQKKCGLTFPLELVRALYMKLHDLLPGWGFDLIQGYDSGTVRYKDRILKFNRGVGLGMMNSTISLIMGFLFEDWKRSQPPELRLNGRFVNDDQVIRFYSAGSRIDISDQGTKERGPSWDSHLEDFQLSIHKKKPFISMAGVFLEVYGDDFPINSDKKCQKVLNLLKCLTASDISEAKDLFSSAADALDETMVCYIPGMLKTVYSYWGIEFSNEEVSLPYEIGGWVSPRECGLKTVFRDMTENQTGWLRHSEMLTVSETSRSLLLRNASLKNKKLASNFKKLENKSYPARNDYSRMVVSSLISGKLSGKNHSIYRNRILRARQEAFESPKALPNSSKIIKYYFEALERGGNYLPPTSIRPVDPISLYRPEYSQELPEPPENVTRLLSKIAQANGILPPELDFQLRRESADCTSCLYRLAYDATRDSRKHPTPLGILTYILGGYEYWEKIQATQVYLDMGVISPLQAHPLLPDIIRWYGANDQNDIIVLDHVYRAAYASGCPDYFPFQTMSMGRGRLAGIVRQLGVPDLEERFSSGSEILDAIRLVTPISLPLNVDNSHPEDQDQPGPTEDLIGGIPVSLYLEEVQRIVRQISPEVNLRESNFYNPIGIIETDVFEGDDDLLEGMFDFG